MTTIRAFILTTLVSVSAVGGCTKPGGKVLATTMAYQMPKPAMAATADSPATAATPGAWVPLVDYRAPGQTGGGPDYDEITGIDSSEPEPAEPAEPTPVATPAPAAAPAPAATPAAAPVVPAKAATPAKTPAAKTPAVPAPKK